jgi:hypothetical protein
MIFMSSEQTKELAPFTKEASRLELIIRWIYGIAIGIVFWLWGIFIGILNFIQFWHILFLGRRNLTIYNHTRRYINATAFVESYLMFLTDARPSLTPNLIFFFKDVEKSEISSKLSGLKSCTSCGVEIPEESKFCPKCGKEQ